MFRVMFTGRMGAAGPEVADVGLFARVRVGRFGVGGKRSEGSRELIVADVRFSLGVPQYHVDSTYDGVPFKGTYSEILVTDES